MTVNTFQDLNDPSKNVAMLGIAMTGPSTDEELIGSPINGLNASQFYWASQETGGGFTYRYYRGTSLLNTVTVSEGTWVLDGQHTLWIGVAAVSITAPVGALTSISKLGGVSTINHSEVADAVLGTEPLSSVPADHQIQSLAVVLTPMPGGLGSLHQVGFLSPGGFGGYPRYNGFVTVWVRVTTSDVTATTVGYDYEYQDTGTSPVEKRFLGPAFRTASQPSAPTTYGLAMRCFRHLADDDDGHSVAVGMNEDGSIRFATPSPERSGALAVRGYGNGYARIAAFSGENLGLYDDTGVDVYDTLPAAIVTAAGADLVKLRGINTVGGSEVWHLRDGLYEPDGTPHYLFNAVGEDFRCYQGRSWAYERERELWLGDAAYAFHWAKIIIANQGVRATKFRDSAFAG